MGELGTSAHGALVGLIMPCRAPAMGTIGYVGVVPEQRGRGYGNITDLLARGTATLLHTGAPVLRADTDIDNVPMATALNTTAPAESVHVGSSRCASPIVVSGYTAGYQPSAARVLSRSEEMWVIRTGSGCARERLRGGDRYLPGRRTRLSSPG